MSIDETHRKTALKKVHVIFLGVAMLSAAIVVYSFLAGYKAVYSVDDPVLRVIVGLMAVFSVACVVMGFLISRWAMLRNRAQARSSIHVAFAMAFRAALFGSVGVFGLVVGLVGGLVIALPFLVTSLTILALTFPN